MCFVLFVFLSNFSYLKAALRNACPFGAALPASGVRPNRMPDFMLIQAYTSPPFIS